MEDQRRIDLVVAGYIIHNNKVLLIHHKKLGLWLPPGGHINPNEVPDDAVKREIKEEVNLAVTVLGTLPVPLGGSAKRNCALPFHTNLHSVGDHDHYCLFYLCVPLNPEQLLLNDEVSRAEWFSIPDLEQERVPPDVKNIALHAFKVYQTSQKNSPKSCKEWNGNA